MLWDSSFVVYESYNNNLMRVRLCVLWLGWLVTARWPIVQTCVSICAQEVTIIILHCMRFIVVTLND